jgi:hypothetical protein
MSIHRASRGARGTRAFGLVLAIVLTLGLILSQGVAGADPPADKETGKPTQATTTEPTPGPTEEPTEDPEPTEEPSEEEPSDEEPSEDPTEEPSEDPTEEPSEEPTEEPSEEPSVGGSDTKATRTASGGQPVAGPPSGDGVQPLFVPDNPDCDDFGFSEELRVNAPSDGTFTDGTLEVEIDVHGLPQGQGFDWESNIAVLAVIVKGGPNANFYDYGSGDTEDTDLHAPVNPNNNQFFGLSHISFCYGEAPPPETGRIIIVKNAIPNSDQDFDYDGDLGTFTLVDDGSGAQNSAVFSGLDPGDFDVTELGPPSGWNLTGIECEDPSGGTTTSGNTASIDLASGETVICTFTNEAEVTPPPSPTPPTPTAPPTVVDGPPRLAFTGANVLVLAGVAGSLLLAGLGLLSLGRKRKHY